MHAGHAFRVKIRPCLVPEPKLHGGVDLHQSIGVLVEPLKWMALEDYGRSVTQKTRTS